VYNLLMTALLAAIAPGMPVHHPAARGRYADFKGGKAAGEVSDGRGASAVEVPIVEGAQPVPSGGAIPFRRATTERTSRLERTTIAALAAAETQVQIQVEGSGYMYGIDVEFDIETAANAAVVAYHEDAPWSVISSVVLGDVNGELWNMTGFHTRVVDLYSGLVSSNDQASTDVQVFEQLAGAVGRGGSVHGHLWVPVAINKRNLLGLVSNQDRAQKYQLRTNIAAGGVGTIYTTAPTTPGAVSIDRTYLNFSVPAGQNAQGVPQEQTPPKFGVLFYGTQTVSPALPSSNTTQNHFLPRIGNTIRLLILVFRDGNGATARTDSEANPPTLIKFTLGDTPLFAETAGARRKIMRDRYGFDAPAGVYVYDFITDIMNRAGSEFGDDYLFTAGLNNAQFEISYGAGWAASSSLTILTHDCIVPPGVNLYD